MNNKQIENRKIDNKNALELQPFHLKDVKRLRDLVAAYYPEQSLSQWRKDARRKRDHGEKLYFLVKDGRDIGGVNLTAPFESETWRIARIRTLISLDEQEVKEILRQIVGDDEKLYRIDVVMTVLTEKSGLKGGRSIDDEWPSHQETYYSPQLSLQKVGFIPWAYGYLALVSTADCEKIESIQFMRKGEEGLSPLVKKAAFYRGLLGFDGVIAGRDDPGEEEECPILKRARLELNKYLLGGYQPDIPFVFPEGTPFQMQVWKETLAIPYGAVRTYADIAERIQPDKDKTGQMARAVGRALAANPLPILIPCHRVIGSNRALVGFGGGVDMKDHLLQLEMWYTVPPS